MRHDCNIHRGQLHKTLGLVDKVPADYSNWWPRTRCFRFPPQFESFGCQPAYIGTFDVVLHTAAEVRKARTRGKSSTHRMFVMCECGREIPTGRLSQHRCKFWPDAALTVRLGQYRFSSSKNNELRFEIREWLRKLLPAVKKEMAVLYLNEGPVRDCIEENGGDPTWVNLIQYAYEMPCLGD